jgi:ankyrin repeat protein
VKVLLAAKDIDVNKEGYFGTPLDIATENNHTEIIQLLKDAGALYAEMGDDIIDNEETEAESLH